MSDVTFDGIDVVTDFTFTCREGVFGTLCTEGGLDFGFVCLIFFGHGIAYVLHYFNADCLLLLLLCGLLLYYYYIVVSFLNYVVKEGETVNVFRAAQSVCQRGKTEMIQ